MTETPKTKRAVLVSLTDDKDGLRLSLDDLVQPAGTPATTWIQDRHVTSKVYSHRTIDELTLTDEALAEIAHYILARLRAARQVWGPNK